MTNWGEWFRYQLKASGDGFIWAFQQIDLSLHHLLPPAPHYMGKWSPARLVWHVTEYERCLALPSMQQWLSGSMPTEDAWSDIDATWLTVQECTSDELTSTFYAVHQEQMQLLDQFAAENWSIPYQTLWGLKPLAWVVTKTYQHRLEHADTLLRMSLRWRDAEEDIAKKAQQKEADEKE